MAKNRIHWAWPLSIAVAGLGAASAAFLGGCRHRNLSWPNKDEESGDYSYQVCMNCGQKRLFDERTFQPLGSFGYDLHELIAKDRVKRLHRMERAMKEQERHIKPAPATPPGPGPQTTNTGDPRIE